jgi:hypothetical protein
VEQWVKEGQIPILFDLNPLNASLAYFTRSIRKKPLSSKAERLMLPPSVFGQAKIVLF